MDFKPLITLLAIVNPLAIVPFFIHYTQGFSREQRQRTIANAEKRRRGERGGHGEKWLKAVSENKKINSCNRVLRVLLSSPR